MRALLPCAEWKRLMQAAPIRRAERFVQQGERRKNDRAIVSGITGMTYPVLRSIGVEQRRAGVDEILLATYVQYKATAPYQHDLRALCAEGGSRTGASVGTPEVVDIDQRRSRQVLLGAAGAA